MVVATQIDVTERSAPSKHCERRIITVPGLIWSTAPTANRPMPISGFWTTPARSIARFKPDILRGFLGSERICTAQELLTQEMLRRSEAYLAEAQALSHTGSSAFNETTILYWSDETYRILGFDPRNGLPSREAALQAIHPDDRERVLEEARQAVHEKRDYKLEFRILLPDGTIKHIEMTAHPKFSASGELVEVVSTIIDVTERKRAQEEHERLRQLESDLAHMNRLSMMGELAASLAHEITQPIAAARNNARAALNFLDKQPADLGEVREALGCVVGDADRAGDHRRPDA